MITLQIVERHNAGLFQELKADMRSGKLKNLFLEKQGWKVVHASKHGWMNWSDFDGVITCTIMTKNPGEEWQFLNVFMGRLANKYATKILNISIQFPDSQPAHEKKARRKKR